MTRQLEVRPRAPGLSCAQRRWSARPVREPGRGTVRSDVIVECVETDVWPPGMPRCALIGIRYSQDSDTECAMPIVEYSARPWVCSLSVFSAANIAGREAAVRLHWVACAAGLPKTPALPAASSVRPEVEGACGGSKAREESDEIIEINYAYHSIWTMGCAVHPALSLHTLCFLTPRQVGLELRTISAPAATRALHLPRSVPSLQADGI